MMTSLEYNGIVKWKNRLQWNQGWPHGQNVSGTSDTSQQGSSKEFSAEDKVLVTELLEKVLK